MPTEDLLTVVATATPDAVHEFPRDEHRRTFGRDATCDIVVPVEPGDRTLSRVAGVVWRMDGELWVRNLSTRHELHLHVPGRPAEPPLPPRRDDGVDRGAARSIPPGLVYLRGPGGCELLVRQTRSPQRAEFGEAQLEEETTRAPDLPDELRSVALALCRPLLAGGNLPASYSQMSEQLGITQKAVRLLVDKLCRLYSDALPDLRRRVEERREAEYRALEAAGEPRLVRGVWVFDSADADAERQRARALALPDYFEVAHLLVRRGILRAGDRNETERDR